MPCDERRSDLPKVGVYCASAADEDLDFACASIALNTDWPDFRVLVAVDDDLAPDRRARVERLRERFAWFDFVETPSRGLTSASDVLQSLVDRLAAAGCARFFHVNDDIAVTRWWLHEAESALRALDAVGVVIPHDGVVSCAQGAGFSGFYYYSREYVERFCPRARAYQTDPVTCYWVDTEFCVRAAHHARLRYAPRCVVLHLHYTSLPATLGFDKPRRARATNSLDDGRVFVERMRAERIDPWRHIPNLREVTPSELIPAMESLRRPDHAWRVEPAHAC